MTPWSTFTGTVLMIPWLVVPFLYVGYLIVVPIRRIFVHDRSLRYWQESVSLHAWSGIALSAPGFLMGVLGGMGESWNPWSLVVVLGTVGCWRIAVSAHRRRPVPTMLAWLPLVVMIGSTHFFAVTARLNPMPGDTAADMDLAAWGIFTHMGLGLVAWLTVTICFALSVRRVNALTARATAELAPSDLATPGFVWPH